VPSLRLLLPLCTVLAFAADESVTWTFDNLQKIGGHSVTVLGTPKVIDTPLGKAVQFNGATDALFFEVHPLAGAEKFTWEVIFRPDSDGPPAQRFFHMQENCLKPASSISNGRSIALRRRRPARRL